MRQPAPEEFSVPRATIGTTREAQPEFLEAPHGAVGGTLAFEQFEDHADRALDLPIGIEHDLVALEYEADRQREAQFAPGGFVEFAAMEARADDVQLRLGEGALHAEHEAVVELGGIVTTVFVDHERAGDGAQFAQAMPVLVGSCQPGGFQGEDRTDLTHRHIADQRLEVRALGRCRAGLSEIAVEDPDLLGLPAERLGLVQQIVLPVRALLVRADLRQRRLANVYAGLPR
jgi:hypothetical protein